MADTRTIAALWRDAVARHGDATAYLTRDDGSWRPVTWAEAGRRAALIANGLLARGIGRGDVVGIIGRTSLEWALVDFALAQIGAVSAPVYASSAPADVRHVLGHSESVAVVCEDEGQADKVRGIAETLPRLGSILTFGDLAALERDGVAHREAFPGALDAAAAGVCEDDVYTIIYTSGTTGLAKGCVILHRNYHTMATTVLEVTAFDIGPRDVLLVYLPLAHNFGRLMLLVGPAAGAVVALEPDPLHVAEALGEVRPTVFPSVPRLFEKIHAAVGDALTEPTGVRRRLVDWALSVGRSAASAREAGRPIPVGLRLRYRVADRLVYAKVKQGLGGRLRVPISGGAPLAPEIGRFFDALDIPIYEGYGLTECTSAATVNRPGATRYGTVGQALPGFELSLAEDGELLLRSPTVFAGYHRDPDATAAVLPGDGWLRTGDIAQIDADGFVTITDRKKDIIVTAGGKNIAPQNLESDLKLSRFVSQALVVGDRRPYAAALITLDGQALAAWAEAEGVDGDTAELAAHPRVRALIQQVVDEVNRDRSRHEQIKRFAILPRDFEIGQDELTPTLKLRRRVCLEHFAADVESLYDEAPNSWGLSQR